MTVLIIGGAGSGKSEAAEHIAMHLDGKKRYYLATMEIWDEECRARVEKHRAQRAGKGFQTVEVPRGLAQAARTLQPGSTVLLECMGNLTANEMFAADGSWCDPTAQILAGVELLQKQMAHLVVVTNEVFLDLPPEDEGMRCYLQTMGKLGCALAKTFDVVIEICAGLPVIWKD